MNSNITPLSEQTMKELLRNRHIVAMCLLRSGEDSAQKDLDEYNIEIDKRIKLRAVKMKNREELIELFKNKFTAKCKEKLEKHIKNLKEDIIYLNIEQNLDKEIVFSYCRNITSTNAFLDYLETENFHASGMWEGKYFYPTDFFFNACYLDESFALDKMIQGLINYIDILGSEELLSFFTTFETMMARKNYNEKRSKE